MDKPEKYTDLQNLGGNVMQAMNGILRDMKEIAELPSEVPQDQQTLLGVGYPKEGGMLTYMSGHDYPYRGFPFFEIVEKIDLIKKVTRGSLSGLYHSLKRTNKLWLITLIPALWVLKNLMETGVYTFYRLVERCRIKTTHYSQAVRELHRSFSLESSEFRNQLRDLACMILEFDNAYRYRFQDVVPELNKKALRKNPIRELNRLWDIAISREKTQEIRDTWRLAKMGSVYLKFDRTLLKTIVSVLLELKLKEVKLTIEDKEFCVPRKDYSFAFLTSPQAEDEKIATLSRLNFERSEELKKVREQGFKEQSELDARHKQVQQSSIRMRGEGEGKIISERIRNEVSKLETEFMLKKDAIMKSHLTPAEVQLLETQSSEMSDCAQKYDRILKEIDENYAQKKINYLKTCQ